MGDFPSANRDAIDRNYNSGLAWRENLEQSNEKSSSPIRENYINVLSELVTKVDESSFFEKAEFSTEEQNAITALANEIAAVTVHVKAQNDLTLCELEIDLSDLTQRIALDSLFGTLKGRWYEGRRQYPRLPQDIPAEVCDAYNVGIFARCEYMLNRRAEILKPISSEWCLNSDDYSNVWFATMELRAANLSSQTVVDDYIQLQIDKRKEEIRAKLNEGPSLGGLIWSLVGWDDPWDFAKDMVLFTVTGGASKIYRWGKRLNKIRKDVRIIEREVGKQMGKLETALETALQKSETRMTGLANKAQKAKRLRAIERIPEKIRKAVEALANAKKQYELIAEAGYAVGGDFIRNVLTSVAANLAVNQGSKTIETQASYEMARMSAMRALETVPPFKRIPTIRSSIGFGTLFRTRGSGDHDALIGQYFAYVWLQEFVVRIVLAIAHQTNFAFKTWSNIAGDRSQPIITSKLARDEAISALGSAVERIWREDLTFLPAPLKEQTKRYVVAFGRKSLVELAQKLADLASTIR